MRLIEKTVLENKVYLIPLGDLHLGSPQCNWEKFTGYIKWVQEHSTAYIFLMGDIFDTAVINGATNVFTQQMSLNEAIKTFYDAIYSVKDRVIGAITGNHECVEWHTEILTKTGWKQAININYSDEVAQFDEQGNISFSTPQYLSYKIAPRIVNVKTNMGDELVTMNHRLIINNKKVKVQDLIIKGFTQTQQRFAGYLSKQYRNAIDYSDDYIRLLVWLIMDGTFVLSSKNKIRIQFKLSKQRKIDKLMEILNKLHIPFTFRKATKSKFNKLQPYMIRIYGQYARDIVKDLDYKKEIPTKWIFGLSEQQAHIVFETIKETDGSPRYNHIQWSSINKTNIERMQLIALFNNIPFKYHKTQNSGFNPNSHIYRANIYPYGLFGSRAKFVVEDKPTAVVAIQTEKGTLITRRNGKVNFTSNSRLERRAHFNPLQNLCNLKDIPYCGYSCVIRFRVGKHLRKDGRISPRVEYVFYAHHTTGGGSTPGGKLNRIAKLREIFEGADAYLGAHNHFKAEGEPSIFYLSKSGNGKATLKKKRIHYIDTGSFVEWDGSYAEMKMLAPAETGAPRIRMDGIRKDLHVSY